MQGQVRPSRCNLKQQPAAPAMSADEIVGKWPPKPQETAKMMIAKYDQP